MSTRINQKKGSIHTAQAINLNVEVNFSIDINDYDSLNTDFSSRNIFAVLLHLENKIVFKKIDVDYC